MASSCNDLDTIRMQILHERSRCMYSAGMVTQGKFKCNVAEAAHTLNSGKLDYLFLIHKILDFRAGSRSFFIIYC